MQPLSLSNSQVEDIIGVRAPNPDPPTVHWIGDIDDGVDAGRAFIDRCAVGAAIDRGRDPKRSARGGRVLKVLPRRTATIGVHDRVATGGTIDRIVSYTWGDFVVAGPAIESVATVAAPEGVVARSPAYIFDVRKRVGERLAVPCAGRRARAQVDIDIPDARLISTIDLGDVAEPQAIDAPGAR